MIRIEQLYKSFKSNHVLQGIDLIFEPGNITAILGPNGSGKTTLIKCLLGMVIPDRGSLYIDDRDVTGRHRYRQDIAYLPQIARFPENLKVSELFRMIANIRGAASKLDILVDTFALKPFLEVKLAALSGGTRQKVNIVQALMFDSPVLILDEPTNGLDPVGVVKIKALIKAEKERGKTILMTSHIMHFVEEMADHVIFLLDGNVQYDDTVSSLLAQFPGASLEDAIARLLSKEVRVSFSTNGVLEKSQTAIQL